jgi:hypothetical protein
MNAGPNAATATAEPVAAEPKGPIAERLAGLRELAESDPTGAQSATWSWIKELGSARAADDLSELFGLGSAPQGLSGPTDGILVVPLIHALADRPLGAITRLWMPWMGKSFDSSGGVGFNRLAGSARWPARLLWPRYATRDGIGGRDAFDFQTRVEPGRIDPAVDVLVIDYEPVESNPGFVIRKIRDELIELVPDTYLGRILWKRGEGDYTNIGYFALKQPAS